MAKVMNTKWFIDRNAGIIDQLYVDRLGMAPEELTTADISDPTVLKALTELRLYRLPPYFKVPTPVKGRIQAQSSVCHDLEDPRRSLRVERELVHLNSVIFNTRVRHDECTKCGSRRASKDGLCYKCKAEDDDTGRPRQEVERELSRVYNNLSVRRDRSDALTWYSPKTLLLADTIGCTFCGVRPEIESVWLGEGLDGWGDGLCPECLPRFPLGESWSLPKTLRADTPSESFSKCQLCKKDEFDYAVWGMCELCYQEWQDRYVDPTSLYKFVDQYGALAALLIRSSVEWIAYMKDMLSHKYCWNPRKPGFPVDADLVPFFPKLQEGRPARELRDLNVDINKLINEETD